jgi:deoxyribonuclease (pyrimidine dimer)
MTRINLVPPEELMDQHLFAEFREIKMVPKSLARSIAARGVQGVLERIPARFTLNTGHVSFFYDKGAYLLERYGLLRVELERRGINFNRESMFDPDGTMLSEHWCRHWEPDAEALQIIRTRIAEKIQLKPHWYRYEGKPII